MSLKIERQLLGYVKRALEFPFPQICKHMVAADLLSLLEERGLPIPDELAKAVVQADDETAIELIDEMMGNQHEETPDEYYDRKWREEMNGTDPNETDQN